MSDISRLERALVAAHEAGDENAARQFAAAIKSARQSAAIPSQGPAPAIQPETGMPEGMVFDPKTNRVIDTKAEAELNARDGGIGQRAAEGLQQFNRGLPFIGEYLDEAAGGIHEAMGGTPGLMRERLRAMDERTQEDRGGMAMAANLAGGIAGSIPMAAAAAPAVIARAPATLAGKMGMGALLGTGAGAVEGGVAGFGRGRNNAQRRAGEAGRGLLVGGAVGGATGAVAPAVAAGVRNVAQNIKGRPDAQALGNMGLTPETAKALEAGIQSDDPAQALARIRAAGDDAMLVDSGPTAAAMLDTAIQKSGRGGRIAREAVEGRATKANQRVAEALDGAFGRPGESQSRDLIVYGDKTSPISLLYKRAYSQPIDYSSEAGREIERLVKDNVPPTVIQRANAMLRTDPDFRGIPQIMADIADDGTVTFREMPTIPQLDLMKRALDDVARAGDGKGALGGNTNEGRIYGNLARRLRDAMREAVPEYGQALDAAGTEIGKKKAYELGQTMLSRTMSRADVAEELRGMPQAELAKVREGVRGQIDEALANVQRTITDGNLDAREAMAAVKTLSSKASREKMETLLGKDAAASLSRQLDEATRSLELRARVQNNSATFARQSMERRIDEMLKPGPVGRLMEGKPVNAAQDIAQVLTGRTPEAMQGMKEQQYAEIAKALTQARGPGAERMMNEILQVLTRRHTLEAQSGAIGRNAGIAAALGGYQLGNQALGR